MNLEILYEDNHLLAVNKAAGVLTQGDKTGDKTLIDFAKSYIKEKYNKPGEVFVGLIHRIDRPVSGVVLIAKTSKALSRMNEQFKNKDIQKTYWAIVEQKPAKENGELIHWLKKNEKLNKSFASNKEGNGALRSELSYAMLASGDKYHLLEVKPKTGRHHQIRVQLSGMGCIIKGDLKYGAKRSNEDASISLHAREVEFIHPIKKENIIITAPVPKDKLWQFFEEQLGGGK
jgi:23S rRNA pseudouridine1911/1915/1917 synthase